LLQRREFGNVSGKHVAVGQYCFEVGHSAEPSYKGLLNHDGTVTALT
jgi:hypothetical protein